MNEGGVVTEQPGGAVLPPRPQPVVPPGVIAPVLAAIVSLALVIVTWRVFVTTRRGQLAEEAARIGSRDAREAFADLTAVMLGVVSVPFLVIVVAAAALVALVQKRWSIAIAAIVVLVGANLTTQVLQSVLARPVEDASTIANNSFPSGHATVAASIAAAALLVVPVRWRPPVAVLGALLAASIGISTMIGTDEIGAWHRASDVVAAMLIASLWYFVAESVLAALAHAGGESHSGGNPPRALVKVPLGILTVLGGICLALGCGGLAATAARAPIASDLGYQLAFGGSVLGVTAVAFLTQAMMLRLRPHHPEPQSAPL